MQASSEPTYLCGGGVLTAAQILEQLRDYNPVYADMVQHIELGGGFALEGGAACGIGAKILTGVIVVLIIVATYYSGLAALVLAQAKIIIGWLTASSSSYFSSIASWASSSFNYVAGMFGVGKDAAQAAFSANSFQNATSAAAAVGKDLVPQGYLFDAKALIPYVGPQSVAITSDISASSTSWAEYAWRLVQVVYSYLTTLFRVNSTVHGEAIWKSVMMPSFTKFFASVCKSLTFTALLPVVNRFLQIVCDVTLGRAVTSHRVKEAVVEASLVCETPEFKRRMELLSPPAGVRSSTRRSERRSSRSDEIDMVREAYAPRKLKITAAEREFVHRWDAQQAAARPHRRVSPRKRENAGEARMRAARAAHKRTPTKRTPAKRSPVKRKHAASPARAPAKKSRKSPRRA